MKDESLSKHFWNADQIFNYGYRIASALLHWSVYTHSSWDSSAYCTLLSGLNQLMDLSLFSQCQTDIKVDGVAHTSAITLIIEPLCKATCRRDFTSWVPNIPSVFLFVRFYQQISTTGASLDSLVGSHARCFLCRSVSWAELSWSLWCSSFPILCRYPQPGDWPPRWASRSLYLNPADSNKHIHHCCLLPNRWTAVKTKNLSRSYNETVSGWIKASASNIKFFKSHTIIANK